LRTILLPSGNLLVPVEPDDPADGFGLRELGPEHPEYGRYLAFAEPGFSHEPKQESAAARRFLQDALPPRLVMYQ
jgi:hypothetical protein